MVRVAHKPNSVPVSGYSEPGNDHSSVNAGCPPPLATYPGAWTGHSQTLLYLVLHRVGFTKLPRSPEELVRSYRTFSPLPGTKPESLVPGGILSVALSFTLPWLHVMEHPALWCSDFPLDQFIDPAIVWTTPTISICRKFLYFYCFVFFCLIVLIIMRNYDPFKYIILWQLGQNFNVS